MKNVLLAALVAMLSNVAFAQEAGTAAITATGAWAGDQLTCELYQDEIVRARSLLEPMMASGVRMPQPVDPGGGASHEQHKRNYQAIYLGGQLYAATGEKRYADFVRELFLGYAELYPTLGPHPAHGQQEPGRLFWQNLNDSVWLVHSIQGYEAIRETLSADDRELIESGVLRLAAEFLSTGSPRTFGRIHNHATWATAAVGMTGYVLGDKALVGKALLGPKQDGEAGFLRQMDVLFSPDGYYSEGPYYQRYALLPFMVFADAIARHEPQREIFAHRSGILLKALRTTIDLSYGGFFLPINDALKDKGLRTDELVQAIAIGYARSADPQLLGVAQWQERTVLSQGGNRIACDINAGKAKPFRFDSRRINDGPDGDEGALILLRQGDGPQASLLVAKNTAQGMGHGHFDKLNWLFYDSGAEIIRDYGSARFLNIEAKQGGIYLPENSSWAKQTIAHNTLVIDELSHFDGDPQAAELKAPEQLYFSADPDLQISVARIEGAYPQSVITRTLAQLTVPGLAHPLVIDLLRVRDAGKHQFDLPLHYQGQIMRVGAPLASNVANRPVLGKANGYQHLWLDAEATPTADQAYMTFLFGERFYTWRWLPQADAQMLLAETGANDPQFNLRREPVLIQRVQASDEAVFVGVLEPHGRYDGAAEQTVASDSQITALRLISESGMDVIEIETKSAGRVLLALSYDADPQHEHRVQHGDQALVWRGFAARFTHAPGRADTHEP